MSIKYCVYYVFEHLKYWPQINEYWLNKYVCQNIVLPWKEKLRKIWQTDRCLYMKNCRRKWDNLLQNDKSRLWSGCLSPVSIFYTAWKKYVTSSPIPNDRQREICCQHNTDFDYKRTMLGIQAHSSLSAENLVEIAITSVDDRNCM